LEGGSGWRDDILLSSGGGGGYRVGDRWGVSGSLLRHAALTADCQEVLYSADLLVLTGD